MINKEKELEYKKKVKDFIKYKKLSSKKILLNPRKPQDVDRLLNVISKGGVGIFFSTATYGLITNGKIKDSVDKIYRIKGRDYNKPLSILTNKKKYYEYIDPQIKDTILLDVISKLINKFWPGYISLIVPKNNKIVKDFITGNLPTVNLLCMDYEASFLAERAEFPLVVTSANISGEKPVVDPIEAITKFYDKVDILLLGPRSSIGINTTIVDLTRFPSIQILREGPISKIQLNNFLEKHYKIKIG